MRKEKIFLEGLRFGLLLQFAVGPICLMVFSTAGNSGLLAGSLAALAVTLVDAGYIFLAAAGASVFLRNSRVKKIVRFAGAGVLILFGLDAAAGTLEVSILPKLTLFRDSGTENSFLKAALMTASNPLTVVFWGGVFSARAASMERGRLWLFGAGCAAATLLFLNTAAVGGSLANSFLPAEVMKFLNLAVGVAIIFFAVKMAREAQT
ncbi:MAG: LysE family translocator [Synergistaceae bacterium]|nr:LysE family translocator [Synergistaceae bacterium]